MPFRRTFIAAAIAFGVLATACSGSDDPNVSTPTGSSPPSNLAASVASSDLWAKAPQRFELGVFKSDGQGVSLLTFGTVDFAFSFLGDGSGAPQPGPSATGTYLGAFGTPQNGPAPTFSAPSEARGVYQAEGITFDQAGTWQVDTTIDVPGSGSTTLSSQFPVAAKPSLPAPGDRALRTENLTMDSKGVPASAIDSRALDGAAVPDPELHATTIAAAIAAHRPVLVIFATPDLLPEPVLRSRGRRRPGPRRRSTPTTRPFIHVEIWRNFNKSVINQAAADWLLREQRPHRALALPDRRRRRHRGPLGAALRRERGREGARRPVNEASTLPPPPTTERCYRHPDVETGVHCTRCGRPICPECMIPAPVGHQCPECVAEARREFRQGPGRRIAVANVRSKASVTMILLLMIGAMFVVEVVAGGPGSLMNGPSGLKLIDLGASVAVAQKPGGDLVGIATGQYWRLFSAMFLHAGIIHIAFNAYALWIFGRVVEEELGRPAIRADLPHDGDLRERRVLRVRSERRRRRRLGRDLRRVRGVRRLQLPAPTPGDRRSTAAERARAHRRQHADRVLDTRDRLARPRRRVRVGPRRRLRRGRCRARRRSGARSSSWGSPGSCAGAWSRSSRGTPPQLHAQFPGLG